MAASLILDYRYLKIIGMYTHVVLIQEIYCNPLALYDDPDSLSFFVEALVNHV